MNRVTVFLCAYVTSLCIDRDSLNGMSKTRLCYYIYIYNAFTHECPHMSNTNTPNECTECAVCLTSFKTRVITNRLSLPLGATNDAAKWRCVKFINRQHKSAYHYDCGLSHNCISQCYHRRIAASMQMVLMFAQTSAL